MVAYVSHYVLLQHECLAAAFISSCKSHDLWPGSHTPDGLVNVKIKNKEQPQCRDLVWKVALRSSSMKLGRLLASNTCLVFIVVRAVGLNHFIECLQWLQFLQYFFDVLQEWLLSATFGRKLLVDQIIRYMLDTNSGHFYENGLQWMLRIKMCLKIQLIMPEKECITVCCEIY